MLDRHGLVRRRGAHVVVRRAGHAFVFVTKTQELWCTDCKGEFLLGNKKYCDPIVQFWQAAIGASGGSIDFRRALHVQSLVKAVGLKEVEEGICLVALWITISAASTWRKKLRSLSTIRLAPSVTHVAVRSVLPVCPGRTV
jgi:hypothetical protein